MKMGGEEPAEVRGEEGHGEAAGQPPRHAGGGHLPERISEEPRRDPHDIKRKVGGGEEEDGQSSEFLKPPLRLPEESRKPPLSRQGLIVATSEVAAHKIA